MIQTRPIDSLPKTRTLLFKLNGPWHKRATLILVLTVCAHWVEHAMQAYQVYGLQQPRPHAHGAIGLLFPWLVTSEWLHYAYVTGILLGLVLLRRGFVGRARTWWTVAVAIQFWHSVEHSLLLGQVLLGHNLFGAAMPTSVLQIVVPRLELHLFYNAMGFIPMVVGLFYHVYPPTGGMAGSLRLGAVEAARARHCVAINESMRQMPR